MNSFEDVISSTVNGPITSFVVIASYLDEDGYNMLYFNTPSEQPAHISMGLVEFAKTYLTKKFIDDIDLED